MDSNFKAAGIVAEFNPFHNGHALLIKKTREAGFSHIAVVMSGNYTQRGEAACMLKGARVRAALCCGADLVVELPLPFAVSSAEGFAFGAVSLLDALGCVGALSFGSECGDIGKLEECAARLLALDGTPELSARLAAGCSFPKARALAVGDDMAKVLEGPNDTLAVEYLKALKKLGSPIRPLAIKRLGSQHDCAPSEIDGLKTASASSLRDMLNSRTPGDAAAFIPPAACEIFEKEFSAKRAPFSAGRAEPLILAQLRRMDAGDLRRLPDVGEGLENRILHASQTACSLDGLYAAIKSKRYTASRIRRIILCAYLGIDPAFTASPPPYLRVLGFNDRGLNILREAKTSATLPVTARHADFARLDSFSQRLYSLECRSTDLFCLCLPQILPCGMEQRYETVRDLR